MYLLHLLLLYQHLVDFILTTGKSEFLNLLSFAELQNILDISHHQATIKLIDTDLFQLT